MMIQDFSWLDLLRGWSFSAGLAHSVLRSKKGGECKSRQNVVVVSSWQLSRIFIARLQADDWFVISVTAFRWCNLRDDSNGTVCRGMCLAVLEIVLCLLCFRITWAPMSGSCRSITWANDEGFHGFLGGGGGGEGVSRAKWANGFCRHWNVNCICCDCRCNYLQFRR